MRIDLNRTTTPAARHGAPSAHAARRVLVLGEGPFLGFAAAPLLGIAGVLTLYAHLGEGGPRFGLGLLLLVGGAALHRALHARLVAVAMRELSGGEEACARAVREVDALVARAFGRASRTPPER